MSIEPIRFEPSLAAPRPSTERTRPPAAETTQGLARPGAGDRLRLSSRSPLDADLRLASLEETTPGRTGEDRESTAKPSPTGEPGAPPKTSPTDPTELDEDQKKQVAELERRDAEVRAHEQAHLAAAGPLAQGGPQFTYETGPDGKRYAVGGEVKIVMRTGSTPEETIRNAARVQAAALAPGDPSPTDQRTAAAASRAASEARQQAAAAGSGAATAPSRSGDGESPAGPSAVAALPGT